MPMSSRPSPFQVADDRDRALRAELKDARVGEPFRGAEAKRPRRCVLVEGADVVDLSPFQSPTTGTVEFPLRPY